MAPDFLYFMRGIIISVNKLLYYNNKYTYKARNNYAVRNKLLGLHNLTVGGAISLSLLFKKYHG